MTKIEEKEDGSFRVDGVNVNRFGTMQNDVGAALAKGRHAKGYVN